MACQYPSEPLLSTSSFRVSTLRSYTVDSSLLLEEDDVRVEGADGFDGLDTTNDNSQQLVRRSNEKRSTTPSGLLYEIAKNLALSGVGRIILVQDDDNDDDTSSSISTDSSGYFDGSLDDLGAAYHRAALAEIGGGSGDDKDMNNLADNRDNSFVEMEDEDEGEDGEVADASKQQIQNEEFKALVDQVASEKATEIDTTPVEVKAFETKLTPEVLKNIGLKPNSKAFKQLQNKNLSDPKVRETFNKLLEDSSATINETITSNLLEEASLRQQAYDYHVFVKQQPKMKKTDIPVSELPSV